MRIYDFRAWVQNGVTYWTCRHTGQAGYTNQEYLRLLYDNKYGTSFDLAYFPVNSGWGDDEPATDQGQYPQALSGLIWIIYYNQNGTFYLGSAHEIEQESSTSPTINLEVDKTRAYAGQTVTVTYETWNTETGTSQSNVPPIVRTLKRKYKRAGSTSYAVDAEYTDYEHGKTVRSFVVPDSYAGGEMYYELTLSEGTDQSVGYLRIAESVHISIAANTRPNPPEYLTVPQTISAGTDFEVSFGEATDPDPGDTIDYILERSIDGGVTWTQKYTGDGVANGRVVTDRLDRGTTRVRYKVRARDNHGALSNPRYNPDGGTSDITITNNNAPTIPDSISVSPSALSVGNSVVVSWGPSSDPDGDAFEYSLERSVNDLTSYEVIYHGLQRTYTDTVGSWTSVSYRVRAIDAHGAASGYRTATTKAVSSNTAPTLTVSPYYKGSPISGTSGSDWGSLDNNPSVAYTPTDADASDTLTAKEYIDGVVKNIRTVRSGEMKQFKFSVNGAGFWNSLTLGPHTLKIEVSDGKATASAEFTFTKATGSVQITLEDDIDATTGLHPAIGALSISGYIPEDVLSGAKGQFDVNMKSDDTAGWENCIVSGGTEYGRKTGNASNVNAVLEGGNYLFLHKFATAGDIFNFQITLNTTGSSEAGKAHIDSIQWAFTETDDLSSVTFNGGSTFPNYVAPVS